MTNQLGGTAFSRPMAAADEGPLDTPFYDLVETRVRRVFANNPILATSFGLHADDHRLGDASRDAVLDEIAEDKAHLARVEALDPAGLSAAARFERDLELHNVRLNLFEADEVRRWERRAQAAADIGDAVFLLFARGSAPLAERLARIADRLDAAPEFLAEARSRAVGPQVALWQQSRAPLRPGPARPVRRGPRSGRAGRSRRGSWPVSTGPSRAPVPPSTAMSRGSTAPWSTPPTTGRSAATCTTS